ncbi:pregnancy zone protein [Octopus bimaculoides]|uniref:NTR domain-containing protein n=1 Tax=Octopus bimaculoides TaxID=37653 RepID=A0A0L8HR34_OCTBM|nr:pregnancy zone protein [Octopus bimaculoides]|eukprot:XP_014770566.1 PREDICTED: pregnancy zone protein-like [Octopus bimaculoides]
MRDRIAIYLVLLAGLITVARSGYFMSFPWIMTANERSWACVHFQDMTSASVEVNLTASAMTLFSKKEVYPNAIGNCIPIDVPFTKEKKAVLSIYGEGFTDFSENSTVIFEDSHKIRISFEKLIILVQPDKPIYKPGQTVKFRALVFDRNYKPWTGDIEKVFITDPKGTRIVQWLDQYVDGLLSLEMQLSDDPILGEWFINIEANGQKRTKKFKVEEYVLPKFELKLNMPPYLSFVSETVDVEICAKYTYGKPVYGKLNGTICIVGLYEMNHKRPCFTFNEYITGCKKYSANSDQLQLRNTSYSLWHVFLHVHATIVEEGTGITKTEKNDELSIKLQNYELEAHPYAKEYFKPGFPQYLKIIVTTPDKKPVPNIDIEVQIQDTNGTLNNYITDNDGMINALIPAQKSSVKRLRIKAVPTSDKMKLDEMKLDSSAAFMYSTEETFVLYQWYSLSNSFISIEPIYNKLPCTNETKLAFYYNYDKTQEPMTIYYQVLSYGKTLVSNSTNHNHSTLHHVSFKEPDLKVASLDIKNNSKMNEKNQDEETDEKEESSEKPKPIYKQTLTIPYQLGPDSTLIVYYIRSDNEIISDSIKIPVKNCFPNPVSMMFNKDSAQPKIDVKLSVKATAKSLCAISMVDKSVHILGGNNQISPENVFEKMSAYNLLRVGQRRKVHHCNYMNFPDFFGPPSPPSEPIRPPVIADNQDLTRETNKSDKPQVKQSRKKKKESKQVKNKARRKNRKEKLRKKDVLSRQRRSYILPSYTYVDAAEAFEATGLAVLTDLNLETKPCDFNYFRNRGVIGAPGPMYYAAPLAEITKDRKPVPAKVQVKQPTHDSTETRSFFPETWLWDIEVVGSDGMFTTNKKVPDTITTWIGNAICTNKEAGIGVSEQVSFNVFKPFFVSYTLPYSAVRGEKVPLIISVFNYLTSCLTVKLQLVTSKDFVIHKHPNKTSLCVCSEKSEVVEYVIIPQEIGEIDINVTAKALNKRSTCDSKGFQIKQRSEDNLSRKLLITAEGLLREYTYNSFFCLEADEDSVKVDTVRLDLPKTHLVPESSRAFVSVIGDLMGPTLSGLENLVKMPYGCGEQNMVGFVPNIYVMQYLKNIDKKESPLISLATKYMEKGYQRELQYQHGDGTFSAFGENDKQGSTWLTAFVLKSFAQAKDFIFIDELIISNIMFWFHSNQMENGCFHEFGKVWSSYLKGGLESNGDIPLTAYSVIAILATNVPNRNFTSMDLINNAMACLSKAEVNDTYTLALMHYAFVLSGSNEEKKNALREELMNRVIRDDGNMYWTRDNKKLEPEETDPWFFYGQASSAEVEITSYVLLGILQDEGMSAVAQTLPVIQWLTKQRNPYGGFTSTQDTVLALQALAQYAKFTYRDGLNMHIAVKGDEFEKEFLIDDINSLVLKTEEIKILPNEIKLKAKGSGCALVQMNVKYNVFEIIANTSPLRLKVFPVYTEGKCDRAILRISVGDLSNSTNMAVSEIKLPTGWVVYRPSLKELESSTNGLVKRAEVQDADTQVNIYFEQLPAREETFSFQIVQNIVLEETKPATSVLYYYYEKQIRTAYVFNLTTRCDKDKPTSGHEKNSTEEIQKRCPVCYDTVPENFMDIFCKSVATYKAGLMNAPSKLKIYSNEKAKPREIINSTVKLDIDSNCKCDNLKHEVSTILAIVTRKNLYDDAAKKIQLNEFSSIFPTSMIKNIRKELKTSPCKIGA